MDIKPHQFVSYLLNDDVEALRSSRSLNICLSCFTCLERCPRNVEPAKLMDGVRQLLVRQRGKDMLSADEIAGLLDPELPQQLLVSAFRKFRG
jgi:heterodisulfide reductase subunit C